MPTVSTVFGPAVRKEGAKLQSSQVPDASTGAALLSAGTAIAATAAKIDTCNASFFMFNSPQWIPISNPTSDRVSSLTKRKRLRAGTSRAGTQIRGVPRERQRRTSELAKKNRLDRATRVRRAGQGGSPRQRPFLVLAGTPIAARHAMSGGYRWRRPG